MKKTLSEIKKSFSQRRKDRKEKKTENRMVASCSVFSAGFAPLREILFEKDFIGNKKKVSRRGAKIAKKKRPKTGWLNLEKTENRMVASCSVFSAGFAPLREILFEKDFIGNKKKRGNGVEEVTEPSAVILSAAKNLLL